MIRASRVGIGYNSQLQRRLLSGLLFIPVGLSVTTDCSTHGAVASPAAGHSNEIYFNTYIMGYHLGIGAPVFPLL